MGAIDYFVDCEIKIPLNVSIDNCLMISFNPSDERIKILQESCKMIQNLQDSCMIGGSSLLVDMGLRWATQASSDHIKVGLAHGVTGSLVSRWAYPE